MNKMLDWLKKFPGHPAMIALTVVLILATGLIVLTHMALGHHMPDGYGDWYVFLGGLSGVNVAGIGVNRTTDYKYQQIKAMATPPTNVITGGPTTVEVPKPDV
jgi:hypothetical protein